MRCLRGRLRSVTLVMGLLNLMGPVCGGCVKCGVGSEGVGLGWRDDLFG